MELSFAAGTKTHERPIVRAFFISKELSQFFFSTNWQAMLYLISSLTAPDVSHLPHYKNISKSCMQSGGLSACWPLRTESWFVLSCCFIPFASKSFSWIYVSSPFWIYISELIFWWSMVISSTSRSLSSSRRFPSLSFGNHFDRISVILLQIYLCLDFCCGQKLHCVFPAQFFPNLFERLASSRRHFALSKSVLFLFLLDRFVARCTRLKVFSGCHNF